MNYNKKIMRKLWYKTYLYSFENNINNNSFVASNKTAEQQADEAVNNYKRFFNIK